MGPIPLLVRLPTNAFQLCFQIVLIAGSIDNNALGFIRESCAAALFADRVADNILFSRLIAVDRRNHSTDSEVNGKLGEKIWTERCSRRGWRASLLGASLDYFAMVQSTPSDLYFRNRSAKADRPNGINSTGQVLQFPHKRDNASRDASLQRGVIVVPSKWTVYRWIGRLPLEAPSRSVCAYAQGRILLFISLQLVAIDAICSASDGLLKTMYRVNCNVKRCKIKTSVNII